VLETDVSLVGVSSVGRTTAMVLVLLRFRARETRRIGGVGGSNHATRLCGDTHTRRDADRLLAL